MNQAAPLVRPPVRLHVHPIAAVRDRLEVADELVGSRVAAADGEPQDLFGCRNVCIVRGHPIDDEGLAERDLLCTGRVGRARDRQQGRGEDRRSAFAPVHRLAVLLDGRWKARSAVS